VAMESVNKAAKSDSSKNSTSSTRGATEAESIVRTLNGFYDLVGHKPEELGTLGKMAAYFLAKGITLAQVAAALNLCVEQCRFPVRLPDIMQRIPGYEVPAIEAEGRAAWDTVIKFVEKYVGCNAEGRYGPEHGTYGAWGAPDEASGKPKHPARYPQLPQRMLDVVRRTGGWVQYKRMTEDDQPFQQKRFFEEYMAWTAVELAMDFGKLLTMPEQKGLPAQDHGRQSKIQEAQPVGRLATLAAEKSMDGTKAARRALAVPELTPERKTELKRQLDEELAKRRR
jgi:hypothetical protein